MHGRLLARLRKNGPLVALQIGGVFDADGPGARLQQRVR